MKFFYLETEIQDAYSQNMTSVRRNGNILFLLFSLFLFSCEETDLPRAEEHSIPRVEIDLDEKYLWSPDSGLYVIGSNGITANCNIDIPANYNQKWEFPAIFRYFPVGADEAAVEDQVGFRIKGNCSREKAMKSIGLYWRSEYGSSSVNYPFFPNLDTEQFKRLLLRNSGNDFGLTMLKDAAMVEIFKGMAQVDYQAYDPVVLYLNNEYWGIHNLRELKTPHHFKYHYGVDTDLVDILEGSVLSPEVDDGYREAFMEEVVHFARDHDLALSVNYNLLAGRMDMENYMDYIIIQTYCRNTDWPVTNEKWWRERNPEGNYHRWRWIAFDLDKAFAPGEVNHVWIGDLIGDDRNPGKEKGFFLFNQLIRNEEFTRDFLGRYIYFLESVFDPDRVEQIVHATRDRIAGEYPKHQEKWQCLSTWQWKREVEKMVTVNRKRNEIMKDLIYALYEE